MNNKEDELTHDLITQNMFKAYLLGIEHAIKTIQEFKIMVEKQLNKVDP